MGKMKGRFWSEANRQENNIKYVTMRAIIKCLAVFLTTRFYSRMGALVRVNGLLKMLQDNDRYININQIRSCADPHEIYFHAVECVTTTLAFDHVMASCRQIYEKALTDHHIH